MKLFYTDKFKRNKADSRTLLAASIEKYMSTELNAQFPQISGEVLVTKIKENKNGKPNINGVKQYSISHSEGYWAVIFDEMSCGFDIQLPKNGKLNRIAKEYYSDEEIKLVTLEGTNGFFRVWARREALIKAAGTTVFSRLPNTLDDIIEYEGKQWRIIDFEPFAGVKATICCDIKSTFKAADEIELIKIR